MNTDIIVTIAIAAIGATWLIRSKLGDLEQALFRHADLDQQRHEDHDRRIIKLEEYRGRR
jgi:hypothetical protein